MDFSKSHSKCLFIILALFLFPLGVFPWKSYAGNYILQGLITNAKDTSLVIVSYQIQNGGKCTEYRTDTCQVLDGRFSLSGYVEGIWPATIELDGHRSRFYLEPGKISLTLVHDRPFLLQETGTSVDDELKTFRRFFRENDSILWIKHKKATEFVYHTEYDYDDVEEYHRWCQKRKMLLLRFCKSHIDYRIVPDLLCQVLEIDNAASFEEEQFARLNSVKRIFRKIPEESKVSATGILFQKKIKIAESAKKAQKHPVGAEIPDLSFVTSDRRCISLSDYRGKAYILLHLWSNYCFDCQEEKKAILDFRKTFQDSLEIISVSRLENNKEEWIHNTGSCQLDWPQVLECWHTDLYNLFSDQIGGMLPVSLLPAYILIDKKGRIISISFGSQKIDGLF